MAPAKKKKTPIKAKEKRIAAKITSKSKAMSKMITSDKEALLANRKAQWDIYKKLQKQVNGAWKKLKTDIQNNEDPQILLQDRTQLLLLLGECNYMTLECSRLASKAKK